MKYLILTTLCVLQFTVAPLQAFHYGPDPTEEFPIEAPSE